MSLPCWFTVGSEISVIELASAIWKLNAVLLEGQGRFLAFKGSRTFRYRSWMYLGILITMEMRSNNYR